MTAATVDIALPESMAVLFQPSRYKVLFGGRGGGKSHSIAKALLAQGMEKRHRILCAREFQSSIGDSVHKLLSDQVHDLGLSSFYEVQRTAIIGRNGTEFLFAGLRHNIASIKSMEGCTRVWVEEAQTVSKASWDTLIPTIRREDSEIWISFNPELDTDETYRRFVANPPPDAIVEKVNWSDNPWFPAVLKQELETLRERDHDAYLTVWEGHTRQVLDGAIYANEIRKATAESRFTKVPYDSAKPVSTFWDLGRADMTSIWFAQQIGFEFRLIDFYQNRGHVLSHYLKVMQERPYVYGTCWLPHDAEHELLAAERTIAQQIKDSGKTVRIVPSVRVADGINAVRTLFPRCWFDADKCADGLNALRRYRYAVNPETGQWSREPLHCDASHAADALRYFALSMVDGDDGWSKPLKADTGWVV
jgi:phage terminase large subunit